MAVGCAACTSAGARPVAARPALAFAADPRPDGACVLEGDPWVAQDDVRFESKEGTRLGPALAAVDARRRLLVSETGSIDWGYRVQLQTVGTGGAPLGEPVDVPHDGSAIGRPSVVVLGDTGRGVVSFVESNGHGFQRVAVRFDCPVAP